ncbi:MAG: DUF58 domain-containing protein [Bacteroidales bacterium]|nr:DUF58 domain-containing protein [Bacteroidales bacterium]
MLTARGWWFLLAVSLISLFGIVALGWWSATIPLLGLTALVWFAYEWLKFASEYHSTATRLILQRTIQQSHRDAVALWAQTPFTVRVTLSARDGLGLPFVVVEDEIVSSQGTRTATRFQGSLTPETPLEREYVARCDDPGMIRLEGVQIRLSDPAGFFYRRLFLRAPQELLVLPPLVDTRGRPCSRKRFNALPPPGLHRVRRPGNSNELLDLRDYRPGDPPKLIAWRPTARRDKLITREFESEVPVRSQLFVDASEAAQSAVSGIPPVARFAQLASAIAQTAMSNRDYVGLTIFDDVQSEYLAPARSESHLIRITRLLATAAARFPGIRSATPNELTEWAYPVAVKYYPELLQPRVNSRPFGLFWQPVSDSRLLILVFILMSWPLFALQPYILENLSLFVETVVAHGYRWQTLIAIMILPSLLAGLLCLIHGIRGFLPRRARQISRRKQLAALYAELDQAGAGAIEHYWNDDPSFVERSQKFLNGHRVPQPRGGILASQSVAHSAGSIAILARAIQAAVSRARDNELYIITMHLTDDDTPLDPLLKAVRLARARHHHVLLLIPSPHAETPPLPLESSAPKPFAAIAQEAQRKCRERRLDAVRTQFAAVGVPLLRVDATDTISSVMEQFDRLRGVRIR